MITNSPKVSSTLTNSNKVSIGETWATITTTWASETRTWLAVSQLIDNSPRILIGNMWALSFYPWLALLPWNTAGGGISNQQRP